MKMEHFMAVSPCIGKRDSSGLKMYYTDQLRQHDAGILDVGVMLTYQPLMYTIPPKAAQFHTYAVCNTTLFSEVHNGLI